MNRLLSSVLILIAGAGAAAACPQAANPGVSAYATDGEDLYSPNSYDVIAGGDQQLNQCGFDHFGHVISNPDFEFSLTGMGGYDRLNIRVEGECDTVLLVSDPGGTWFFDDDSSGLDPAIDIMSPSEGVYDIWVGTFLPDTCQAVLTLETF